MKSNFKSYTISIIALVMLLATSCNDVLDEQPRSALVPDFFKTGPGLNAGVTSAYASFKFYYATEGGMNLNVYGTDEFTHGQQVNNPSLSVYDATLNPANGDLLTPWNRSYSAINTCNGIIELGPLATDLTEVQKTGLIAEAKFIRANWYFILVRTFGDVTLDLGSGPLKFNTSPTNIASRAPMSEVYDAIVQDLTDAVAELPATRPTTPGRAWKASALHLLAKVYLTRGYSSAAQGSDFQNALANAQDLITNAATYGVSLLPNYVDIFREGNEGNNETLFQVNWIDNATFNNTQANGLGGDPGLSQNKSHFLFRMLYVTNTPGMIRDVANGRPFVRYKPTAYLMNTAFADKVNDSRYDKSFQTVWYCNSTTTLNPKGLKLGDTAIWMVPEHLAAIKAPLKDSKPYVMFLPTAATDPRIYFNNAANAYTNYAGYNIQNQYFPSLRKFNSTQARPGNDPNISSVRPYIVYRFAETYLIAAEAALKLNQSAAQVAAFINPVRERAGDSPAAKAAMIATTEAGVTATGIDYILDERTRELAGEQTRWFDLVRTGKLIERVNLYNGVTARPGNINPDGTITGAAQTVPNPQAHHLLRPIPQTQIDAAVDPTTESLKYPQNPGY